MKFSLPKFKNSLRELYDYELSEGRIALLVPIFFGFGIGAYFCLDHEPDFKRTCYGLFACSLVFTLSCAVRKKFILPSIALLLFALGFFLANLEAINKKAPKIKPDLGVIWLRGNIDKIERQEKQMRLLLKNNDLWQPETGKFKKSQTPDVIRLNVRTKITNPENLNENDYVQIKVVLSPPPAYPAYPGGYDFARYAYFEKVGAVGFAISDIKILKDHKENFITKIRNIINKRFDAAIENKDHANIAKALVTGDMSGVSDDINQRLRFSGLGHVLSISGLHLSIVMLWVYLFIRSFFALIPKLALHYNIKKFAAIIAIIFGFMYLLLADCPVPAVRSYIMLTMFFLAILIDREITPMRPVAIAGLLILIIEPHALITPSFQLSFASIIGIAGCYEIYQKYRNIEEDFFKKKNILIMILKYLGAIMATSIIAGIVTAPYTSYHFGNVSKYGLFSNALCLPAISFLTMPFLALASIFLPLGLEHIPLKIAELGIDLMIYTSTIFGGDDSVIWKIGSLPKYFLIFASLAWLLIFTFRSRINLVGVPLILICYLIILFWQKSPNIAVDSGGKYFAIKDNGNYYFFGRSGGFKQKQFLEKLAQSKALRLPKENKFCTNDNCFTDKIAIIKNTTEAKNICDRKLIFNLSEEKINCKDSKIITLSHLKKNGTYIGWNNGKLFNVLDYSGRRLWNN